MTLETPDQTYLVYGAGGFAREVAWLLETLNQGEGRHIVAAFVDDSEPRISELVSVPVLSLEEASARHPNAAVALAIGSPRARESTCQRCRAAGLRIAMAISPDARLGPRIQIGEGVVICSGSTLTCDIRLGAGVQINLDCTIGHDAVINDWVTLAPGVHISGHVHVEEGVYVGTGACVINGIEGEPVVIGAGATIGAGAVVTRSIPPGVTAIGIPARAR